MKIEEGTTENSLENIRELLPKYGPIAKIDFKADTKKGDYSVVVHWTTGRRFIFTGFAWGYGGTGPSGLNEFLQLVGITDLTAAKIPIDQFGKTDSTYFLNEQPHG